MISLNCFMKLNLFILIFTLSSLVAAPRLTVEKVEGTVEISKKGKDRWKDAKVGKPLRSKEVIRTQASSGAELKYQDGSLLAIGEQTQVSVSEVLDTLERFVEVDKGHLRFDVRKLSKGESFKFKTPTATAAIRGTECDFGTNIRQSLIGCREGKVEFNNLLGSDSAIVCTGCILLQKSESGFPVMAFIPNATEFERLLAEMMDALMSANDYDLDPDSLFQALGVFKPSEIKVYGDVDSTLSYLLFSRPLDTLTLQAPAQGMLDGQFYDFSSWTSSGDSLLISQPSDFRTQVISYGGTSEIRALYEPAYFQLQVENENCKVDGLSEPYRVPKGKPLNVKVVGNEGFGLYKINYSEDEFSVSDQPENFYEIQPLVDSAKVSFICKENLKKLSAKTTPGGSIVPPGPWVVSDQELVQVNAVAEPGYHFVGWEYEGLKMDPDTSAIANILVLDSNAVLQAKFEPIVVEKPTQVLELEFFDEEGNSKTLKMEYK